MAGKRAGIGGVWCGPMDGGADDGQDPQNQPTQTPQTQTPPSQSPQKVPTSDPDDGQPKASDMQNAPKKDPGALPTQDDSDIKHDGGKTDIDAVGNRNVGCGRGVGNWYSVEKQVAMGPVVFPAD